MNEEQSIAYYAGGKRNDTDAPWSQLLNAAHRRERLEMDYYTISRVATSTRRIDPYYIVWIQSYCNLIAFCFTRQCVINFAHDSILEVRRTQEIFTFRKGFSLAGHLSGALRPMLGDMTEIVLCFDTEIARWAKRRAWEFPHRLTDQPDGSFLLSGSVRGLNDIRKQLLAWGRHVRMIESGALQKLLLDEARAIASLYEAV